MLCRTRNSTRRMGQAELPLVPMRRVLVNERVRLAELLSLLTSLAVSPPLLGQNPLKTLARRRAGWTHRLGVEQEAQSRRQIFEWPDPKFVPKAWVR